MKTLSLKIKFALIMVILSLLSAGTVGLIILLKARDSIGKVSLLYAKGDSEASASAVKAFLDPYWFTVENIKHTMERYNDLSPSERRSFFNAELEALVKDNQGILAAYCSWDPNALEGDDSQYMDIPGTSRKDGRFVPYWFRTSTGIKVETLDKPEDNDYYVSIKNFGHTKLFDPYFYMVDGKNVLMTSIAAPIRSKKGTIIGIIGIDIGLEEIQKISQAHQPLGEAFTAVFSNDGTVTAHFDPSRIGKKVMETETDMMGPYLDDYMKSLREGRPYSFVRYIPAVESDMTLFFSPIRVGTSSTPWSFAVAITTKTVMAPVYDMIRIAVYASIAMIVAVIIVAVIMSLSISKPIVKVTNTLKNISEGEGDLTKRLEVRSGGEIGALVSYFNKLMNAIHYPIKETKTTVSNLAVAADKLSSVSDKLSDISKETVNHVSNATSTAEQVAENIRAMASGAEQASVNASEVASTTEQMAVNINAMANGAKQASVNASDVASTAEQMSTNMNTIASAIEEMSTSIRQISGNADEARSIAKEATIKSSEATSAMNKLGVAAKEIGQVTNVIKKIADKTNLLALNATIEAASAGEAGKGFAVVASEIKELANQSAKSADDITNRIDGVQNETNSAVKVIQEVSSTIIKINQSVESIAGHVEQQTKASNEISNNVAQANIGAKRVASAIGEVARGTNEIASNVAQASTGAKRVASAISEVAKGSRDIAMNAGEAVKGTSSIKEIMAIASKVAAESNQEASQLNSSANDLSETADSLRKVIDKFKV
ncbi:methyl-accepting chemotaxis protein [Fibrobacteria bacterium R8-3-H12]